MRLYHLFGIAMSLFLGVGVAAGGDPSPLRVLSIQPNDTHACVAALLRLDATEALAGVRWVNNDADAPLARILLLEGQEGIPPELATTGMVVENLRGGSGCWTDALLAQPVISSTRRIYVVFVFPTGGLTSAVGQGGGAGIGVQSTTGRVPFFISADGVEWIAFGAGTQLMVEPVLESSLGKAPRPAAVLSSLAAQVNYRGATRSEPERPDRSELEAAVPNPFNPATEIRYALAEPCDVALGIYNMRGQLVARLVKEAQAPGRYAAVWRGTDERGAGVASGTYVARLEACGQQFTRRLTLLR